MSENPFGEGFDFGSVLEQAQRMQERLIAAQDELAAVELRGSAGPVTVTLNGTGEFTRVQFADGTQAVDAEALVDLGDLIVAAYRDAKVQADAVAQEKLGPLTGGSGV